MGYLVDSQIATDPALRTKVKMALVSVTYDILSTTDPATEDANMMKTAKYAYAVANNMQDSFVVTRFIEQIVINCNITTSSTENEIKTAIQTVLPILAWGYNG